MDERLLIKMKKIVLLSDGTGNSSANPYKTNVWRTYQALDRSEQSKQIAYYDNGVGTSSFAPMTILGLVFGWGLGRNVKDIYGFLCRIYNPGDEIYCFGFSRGAYTIRVVADFIAWEGILDRNLATDEKELERLISAAYSSYRKEKVNAYWFSGFIGSLGPWLKKVWHVWIHGRTRYTHSKNLARRTSLDEHVQPTKIIRFLGVWDTVAAYGMPVDELTRAWDMVVWPLFAKDRFLSTRVARACHALSIDDERMSFKPTLFNEEPEVSTEAITDERISQVWFSGVHSNVGGGYPDDSLSHCSLNWMLCCAEKCGLKFNSAKRAEQRHAVNSLGPVNDSRAGGGNFYRYAPRNIEHLYGEQVLEDSSWFNASWAKLTGKFPKPRYAAPKLHYSVLQRIANGGDSYSPFNLPQDYLVVDDNGKLYKQPNETTLDEEPKAAVEKGLKSEPLLAHQSPTIIETRQQAEKRYSQQRFVWSDVWLRKFNYFTTLFAVGAIGVFPYMKDREPTPNGLEQPALADFFEPFLGTLSGIVRGIPELIGKIPGLEFAAGWANKYAAYPYIFLGFIVFILASLWTSRWLRVSIKSQMSQHWYHLSNPDHDAAIMVSGAKKYFHRVIEGPIIKGYEYVIAQFVRVAAIGLFASLSVAFFFQLGYTIVDGIGFNPCKAAPALQKDPAYGHVFDGSSACSDTGSKVERKQEYVVSFEVDSNWGDKNSEANALGLIRPPKISERYAAPLLRHLLADWHQPILRVGHTSLDIYKLENNYGVTEPGPSLSRVHFKFQARRSGKLYIYLNDRLRPWPSIYAAYRNNVGYCADKQVENCTTRAIVTVTTRKKFDENQQLQNTRNVISSPP